MATLVMKSTDGRDEVLKLKGGVNRIGRSAANDYTILDGSVSRFHCEVEVGPHAMSVHDLDSSNGTFVNDLPVEGWAALERGQVLRLGNVRLEVREAPEPPPEVATAQCANHPGVPASMCSARNAVSSFAGPASTSSNVPAAASCVSVPPAAAFANPSLPVTPGQREPWGAS